MRALYGRNYNNKKHLVINTAPGESIIIGALWPSRFLLQVSYIPLNGNIKHEVPHNKLQQRPDRKTGITLLLAAFNEPCRVNTRYRGEQYSDSWVAVFDQQKIDASDYQEMALIRMRLARLGMSPKGFWDLADKLDTHLKDAYYLACDAVGLHGSNGLVWLQGCKERSSFEGILPAIQDLIIASAEEIALCMLRATDDVASTLAMIRHSPQTIRRPKRT